jgi:hypothetical protein
MNFSARAHASSESPRKVTSLSRTTRLSSTFTPKHFGSFDESAHFVHGARHEELRSGLLRGARKLLWRSRSDRAGLRMADRRDDPVAAVASEVRSKPCGEGREPLRPGLLRRC